MLHVFDVFFFELEKLHVLLILDIQLLTLSGFGSKVKLPFWGPPLRLRPCFKGVLGVHGGGDFDRHVFVPSF